VRFWAIKKVKQVGLETPFCKSHLIFGNNPLNYHRKSAELNEYIRMLKLKALTIHRELELNGKLFTARLIMNRIYNVEADKRTLLSIFRKHNEDCRKLIGIEYVEITVRRFDNCCKYLGVLIQQKIRLRKSAIKNFVFI
jgi:hypothetical protein